jgi:hypothetical protein
VVCSGGQWCAVVCGGVRCCAVLCGGVQWGPVGCIRTRWCEVACGEVKRGAVGVPVCWLHPLVSTLQHQHHLAPCQLQQVLGQCPIARGGDRLTTQGIAQGRIEPRRDQHQLGVVLQMKTGKRDSIIVRVRVQPADSFRGVSGARGCLET